MSRSLSDPLHERLLRSFPPDRAYTRADWDDDAMPPPVAHFLGQLLHHHSRREARRLRRARTDWVNYDHPEMETAVRTFFDAVESHTQVPADEWKTTLRQATHHTTAHLVRPVYVLSNFVFGERGKPLPIPEVLWRMNFFKPYAYLREAVHTFAEQRDLERLSPDRFETFLHRIDERITADFSTGRWIRLLDPLFTLARRATTREQIPVALLQTFFQEKNEEAIAHQLARHESDGHEEVGPKSLYRLIDAAASGPAPPEREAPSGRNAPPASPERSSAESSSPSSPSPPEMTPSDDIWGVAGSAQPEGAGPDGQGPAQPGEGGDEGTPLWKRFQQGRTGGATESRQHDAGDPNSGRSNAGGTDDQQPIWAQFQQNRDRSLSDTVSASNPSDASTPTGSSSSPPDPDPESSTARSGRSGTTTELETLERETLGTSNPPHRAVYVRQLFNGDQRAYQQVLQRLRSADSWGEASQIIASDVFRTYKVNIYSDAAVHFTNAVESRFRET